MCLLQRKLDKDVAKGCSITSKIIRRYCFYMTTTVIILVSLLHRGMNWFSFGLAVALCKQMKLPEARKIPSATFSMYYKLLIVMSFLTTLISASVNTFISLSMAVITISTLYARQILVHHINTRTDTNNNKLTKQLHTSGFNIQLFQLGSLGYGITSL